MLKQCMENVGEGLLHACISSIGGGKGGGLGGYRPPKKDSKF